MCEIRHVSGLTVLIKKELLKANLELIVGYFEFRVVHPELLFYTIHKVWMPKSRSRSLLCAIIAIGQCLRKLAAMELAS